MARPILKNVCHSMKHFINHVTIWDSQIFRRNKSNPSPMGTKSENSSYCDNLFVKRSIPTVCLAHMGINALRQDALLIKGIINKILRLYRLIIAANFKQHKFFRQNFSPIFLDKFEWYKTHVKHK